MNDRLSDGKDEKFYNLTQGNLSRAGASHFATANFTHWLQLRHIRGKIITLRDVFHIVPCFTSPYWRTLETLTLGVLFPLHSCTHETSTVIHSFLGWDIVNWRNTFGGSG